METILDVLLDACEGFGYQERHLDMSNRQKQVIAYLRKNKGNIITVDIYSKRYNVDISIARSELDELLKVGIITACETIRTEYRAK